jgi:hypothetical protein
LRSDCALLREASFEALFSRRNLPLAHEQTQQNGATRFAACKATMSHRRTKADTLVKRDPSVHLFTPSASEERRPNCNNALQRKKDD